MRQSVKQFVKLVCNTLELDEPIYEFGSLQVPGQVGFADLRGLFLGKTYIGADMRSGPGVDVVLDVTQIDLPDASVGTLLCMETLEHVHSPFVAMSELFRVLKPNGVLIVSAPFFIPLHGSPYDYWRFTPDGFKELLKPFDRAVVELEGEKDRPIGVVGVGVKGEKPGFERLETRLQDWRRRHRHGLVRSVKLFIPPIVYPVLWRLKTWSRGRA